MKWDELSTDEKNKLISDKIFNGQEQQDMQGVRCGICGHVLPYDHREHMCGSTLPVKVPSYSTSLDDAWLIMGRFQEMYRSNSITYLWHFRFVEIVWDMDKWYSWPAEKMCNAICLAALRACGVEVE